MTVEVIKTKKQICQNGRVNFFLSHLSLKRKTGGWQFLFSTNLCLPLSNVSCNKFTNVFFSIMFQLIKMAMANSNKRLSLDGDFLMANQIAISDHERGRGSSGGFCAQEAELGAKEEVKGRQWLEGGSACLPLSGGAFCHRFPRLFISERSNQRNLHHFLLHSCLHWMARGWNSGSEVDEEDSLRLALFTPLLAPMAWVECIQAVVLYFKKWGGTGSEVGKWKSY